MMSSIVLFSWNVQNKVFTKALIKTGEIQGIPVIDHIIVGDNKYYSFYENQDILNL